METPNNIMVQVCFPSIQASVLDSLNRQREDGQLCDLAINVQGQVFKAHRCVLAASSPYFHDQVLLKNMSTVSIPAVMDPLAFESVLRCAYTGQLRMLREDIVNYLTVGSVLQMWHIVDKCTELLKESKGGSSGPRGTDIAPENTGCSSSANKDVYGDGGDTQSIVHPPNRPSLSESQSPSSTNYFKASPRPKRPTYSQPSIMPRKQWVVVKTEHSRDDDLIVVSGEEGGDDEEERELEIAKERERERTFNISNVRTLSADLGSREEMETQGGIDSGLESLDGNGTGTSGKVFMCHCGKKFTHKSMRDRHINMHLDLRPFHCPVCAKKFKMKHHLTEHMKTHTGLKPYDCHGCGKKFMWRDSFMRHHTSHCHTQSASITQYVCLL
uniref:Zinc finger and BTB domain containing 22b n=1 Tax=Electrophorus electricus TaxID=8005 RepID=A0A4W4HD09_ELEEL